MGPSLSLPLLLSTSESDSDDCSGDAATGGGPVMDQMSSRLSVDDEAAPLVKLLSVPFSHALKFPSCELRDWTLLS